ncbi:Z1 domain-containing protein [Spiroplasma culicicola]|uniref:Putative endonuclease n=1 Tax=Spiroplasma culicicola AES-1 TaxID=1276246 RepID=W6A734_9MOLU|nr:Z1 domain-containing protein [Spiroplasma culicicola]AHI52776.1 putative endonuclease [Spiroplasma culicicola AES-1]
MTNNAETIYKQYLALENFNMFSKAEIIDKLAIKFELPKEQILKIVSEDPNRNIFNFKNSKILKYKPIEELELTNFTNYLQGLNRNYIDLKNLKEETVDILKQISVADEVEEFKIKGLVIGDIQSGKTSSMVGLINGAFDIGYKSVILLSGLINDLREQTSKRLNQGFGVEKDEINSWFDLEKQDIVNQTIDGEISKSNSTRYMLNETKKTYWVTKKTVPILKTLNSLFDQYHEFSLKPTSDGKESDLTKTLNSKILIIDDEGDLASQDASSASSENVTKTNALIIELMKKFKKVSYVSYTATPFANLLTDRDKTHEGETLFPDKFISLITPGINYTGFSKFNRLYSEFNSVKFLNEEKLKEFKNDNFIDFDKYNDFIETIKVFLFTTSLFKLNENSMVVENEYFKTMLINIDIKNDNQILFRNHVQNILMQIKKEFMFNTESFKNELEQIIKDKYFNLYYLFIEKFNFDFWNTFEHVLDNAEIKIVNKDNIDSKVFEIETSKIEKIQIVIGGFKLSRGLTIPGLFTTVFWRNTNTFDSAMQMCRWFGYRDNYLEYITVFTTKKAWSDFYSMFETYDDFKKEVTFQEEQGLSADEFIIKISSAHRLLPTSKNKMKGADKIYDKWSKTGRNQIYNYDLDEKILENNLNVLSEWTKEIEFTEYKHNFIAQNVKFNNIKNLLENLTFENMAKQKIDNHCMIFDKNQSDKWDVVIKNIHSKANGIHYLNENISINLSKKSFVWKHIDNKNIAHVRTILTTDFENYFFDLEDNNVNNQYEFKSKLLDLNHPVLFISLLKFVNEVEDENNQSQLPVVAIAFYNPHEKEIYKSNKIVYINTSGQEITEEEILS